MRGHEVDQLCSILVTIEEGSCVVSPNTEVRATVAAEVGKVHEKQLKCVPSDWLYT